MTKHSEPQLGFIVHIEPRPGFTLAEARNLDRCLEDYAEAHDLDLGHHQLTRLVTAQDRSMTATDQVDLLDWLVSQPGVSSIRVSVLTDRLATPEPSSVWAGGFVHVSMADVGLIGLTILYRARRITAPLYLQILGGFVRPLAIH